MFCSFCSWKQIRLENQWSKMRKISREKGAVGQKRAKKCNVLFEWPLSKFSILCRNSHRTKARFLFCGQRIKTRMIVSHHAQMIFFFSAWEKLTFYNNRKCFCDEHRKNYFFAFFILFLDHFCHLFWVKNIKLFKCGFCSNSLQFAKDHIWILPCFWVDMFTNIFFQKTSFLTFFS